jgi:CRISP-associated protein Cas1
MAIIEDLIVTERGAFVGLHGGRLRVSVKDGATVDAPLLHLRSVQILTRSASISAAALSACCENGVPVHFVDSFDGNYATVLSSRLTTVVTTRRAQIEAVHTDCGVEIARQIAIGKIRSQANNLRYLSRRLDDELQQDFKQRALDILNYTHNLEKLVALTIEDVRAEMMGFEGHCAHLYWDMLGHLIPEEYEWPGRIGRHATDPVNSLLNYGYGILYGEVQNALMIAGLEPYVGLIHTDRPGKPSLTLDLIEEFRAPIVDRTVVGLVNRRYEVRYDDDGRLERDFRKGFAEHILSRLKAQGNYGGKRYQLRSIIQLQARALATAMRGEGQYVAYGGG